MTLLSVSGPDPEVPTQPPVLRRRIRIAAAAFFICVVGVMTESHRAETFRRTSVETIGTVSVNVYRRPNLFSQRYSVSPTWRYRQSWRRSSAVYSVTFVDDVGQSHTYRYKTVRLRTNRPIRGAETGDRVPVWFVPGDPTNFAVEEREPGTWIAHFVLVGLISMLFWLGTGWDYLTTRPRRAATADAVPDHVLTDGT